MKLTSLRLLSSVLCLLALALAPATTKSPAQTPPAINTTISAKTAPKIETPKALSLAKKYWLWASPIIEPACSGDFNTVITQPPTFVGAVKNEQLAVTLSADITILTVLGGAPNTVAALACAAFDAAPASIEPAQNLGCAIATFSDDNTDPKIHAKQTEIHADAETLLQYAVCLSIDNGNYTAASLEPLVTLGNLCIDMKKYDDARDKFETALKICKGYSPALAGMITYYQATNNSRQLTLFMQSASDDAAQNPSELGKATNKLDDIQKPLREDHDLSTQENLENYMDKIKDMDAVTYADLIDKIDPDTATEIRNHAKALNQKMTLKIPDMSLLTQFTELSPQTLNMITASAGAVGQEVQYVAKYAVRYTLQSQADMYQNMGINAQVTIPGLGSMSMTDLMRDAAKNPQKYEQLDKQNGGMQVNVNPDEMKKAALAYAAGMMKNMMGAMQASASGDPDAGTKVMKTVSKSEPIYAVMTMNPFDYANSWDVIIQQYNVKPLMEKLNALTSYVTMVPNESSTKLMPIRQKYMEDAMRIQSAESNELVDLQAQYYEKLKQLGNQRLDDDQMAQAKKGLEAQLKMDTCKVKMKYNPELRAAAQSAWKQATAITSVAYKKLEKHIPVMYQSVMKHLVYISDEKIRQQLEDKMVGAIARGLQTAITNLIMAYTMVGDGGLSEQQWIEENCGAEELAKLQETINVSEQDMRNIQAAKMNDFKSGKIDENTPLFRELDAKYGVNINFLFFKYRVNEFFTSAYFSLPTPYFSFSKSIYENNITGNTNVNMDVSVRAKAGMMSGEVKYGTTYVKDKKGIIHPLDQRLEYSAKFGMGSLSLSSGRSFSTLRGDRAFNKLELSGNKVIDGWKKEFAGKDLASLIPGKLPPLTLWNGQYKLDE